MDDLLPYISNGHVSNIAIEAKLFAEQPMYTVQCDLAGSNNKNRLTKQNFKQTLL